MLPQESRDVIAYCVGRAFPILEINDYGHLVLDVSADVVPVFGSDMHFIDVEPEYCMLRPD